PRDAALLLHHGAGRGAGLCISAAGELPAAADEGLMQVRETPGISAVRKCPGGPSMRREEFRSPSYKRPRDVRTHRPAAVDAGAGSGSRDCGRVAAQRFVLLAAPALCVVPGRAAAEPPIGLRDRRPE